MPVPKYNPKTDEIRLAEWWESEGIYRYDPDSADPVYSIDTPPATVSGMMHLGHVYSYSHADFMARFWRMNGRNVFYPMGFDDNGLPTERLVEKETGRTAEEIGRESFIRLCLEMSRDYEREYETLWRRLGLSVDWRHTYQTIEAGSRKIAQQSFIDLYRKDLAYRRQAPTIWCPTCHTAIAQAEEKDLHRTSEFVDLAFHLEEGEILTIATTRPELLPACVAIFVHPDDERYRELVGRHARVPLFGQVVPILSDPRADPKKGTGAVMCCTFGDTVDVEWWYAHNLPLRESIDHHGRLTDIAGQFAGMTIGEAQRAIKEALTQSGELLKSLPVDQTVRVHERCDTPVEYIVTRQWFIRVLDHREALLHAGEQLNWRPEHMKARYREWVQGLQWDWCVSRQRYYGVTFPVWYCEGCDEVVLAEDSQLPVDPITTRPTRPCVCGSDAFRPEEDVMDTWATSCLSPQIAGKMLSDPELYARVFPMSLRPQAHEIIRTWAFYTIVMSQYRFGALPWKDVLISGWGLAPSGTEKISKSRGGGPVAPLQMLERYSADACRYWAAGTGLGKDALINEEKIQAGVKLVNKLWNVANFSSGFLEGYEPAETTPKSLSPADRWILSRTERLIRQAGKDFRRYEYAAAKNATEEFFWTDLCDNYLEMAKKRLYDGTEDQRAAACFTLHRALSTVVLLFAPILPYITEAIYQALFRRESNSVHRASWPVADDSFIDPPAELAGEALVQIAIAVRRYKSEHNLSLATPLATVHVGVKPDLAGQLLGAEDDIASVTRAAQVTIGTTLDPSLETIYEGQAPTAITVSVSPLQGPIH
jgi:valyl-tRNA synthetase